MNDIANQEPFLTRLFQYDDDILGVYKYTHGGFEGEIELRCGPDLTPREHEVLELISQGLTNSAIAEQLVLSPKTVRNHVFNIFSKLQVSDQGQAIIRARQAGMGKEK